MSHSLFLPSPTQFFSQQDNGYSKIPLLAVLTTQRLLMRPLIASDLRSFHSLFSEHYLRSVFSFSEAQLEKSSFSSLFEKIITSYKTKTPCFICALADKESFEFVGTCIFVHIPTCWQARSSTPVPLPPSQLPGEDVEILCAIKSAYRGHGLGREALKGLLRYAMGHGARRVFIRTEGTERSSNTAIEAGFVHSGFNGEKGLPVFVCERGKDM